MILKNNSILTRRSKSKNCGNKQKKNNFDLIRLLAALVVVIAHTATRSQYKPLLSVEAILDPKIAVDCFFIISGFLIFRSFDRSSSLTSYIQKRVKRIFPGYAAVIIISAFSLYFISSASFSEYFGIDLLKYIIFNLITLNFLQPILPGVFENQGVQAVNTSLWTIKIEVMFYMAVPLIAYILSKTNKILGIGVIYLLSILYSTVIMQFGDYLSPELLTQLEQQLPGQMAFFISGAFFYYFYDQFKENALKLLPLAIVIIVIHNYVWEVYFLYPLSLAVITLYFCLLFKYLGNFGKYGDFSYGMYIWHFPILQVFVYYQLFNNPLMAIPLLFVCVFFVSYLSWNLIEKPFLNRRSHYVVADANK